MNDTARALRTLVLALAGATALLLSACAGSPDVEDEDLADPSTLEEEEAPGTEPDADAQAEDTDAEVGSATTGGDTTTTTAEDATCTTPECRKLGGS